MTETVLIVDDEDGVRRTFQEWLAGVPGIRVYAAADAEAALKIVNEVPIDLTILDWNLGAGSDGLRLLEDLVEFQPEIVAILVTGFANQATPLDALRMGVRDYLDKNQDLNRETFLAAVMKQLVKIIPAKRQRELNRSLAEFREAVAKVLPLVQGSAALHDPLPLPVAVHTLFRFLLTATGAKSGALVVRHLPTGAPETAAAYGPDGTALSVGSVPFSRTLGASVVSRQEPCIMNQLGSPDDSIEWLPFEEGHPLDDEGLDLERVARAVGAACIDEGRERFFRERHGPGRCHRSAPRAYFAPGWPSGDRPGRGRGERCPLPGQKPSSQGPTSL